MKEDNDQDRFLHGYDAGVIVDGTVKFDSDRSCFVLVDDEGVVFNPQEVLKSLEGKQIRITLVSFESLQKMEEMMKSSGGSIILDRK
jgi:hypothetical protein